MPARERGPTVTIFVQHWENGPLPIEIGLGGDLIAALEARLAIDNLPRFLHI